VYNRTEFLSLATDVRNKTVSGFFPKDGKTAGVVNPVKLPNGKYDANNHHRGLISTDLPEENWPYPTSNWAWRDQFAQRLRSYTEGLIYFSQTDTSLPETFRKEALEVGFAEDEYLDNEHFPRQIYVREGRRIEGKHLFTALDAVPVAGSKRPPVHRSSITSSHYAIDSHAMHKREAGHKILDGFISYHTKPFTVPFEVMVPVEKEQILCPVPVSASHVGFGCLRMEPCWMGMGQAAGVAAALAIRQNCLVSKVSIDSIQTLLIQQKANLIYVSDVTQLHKDYVFTQKIALLGWLPDYEARLDEAVKEEDLRLLAEKTGIPMPEISHLAVKESRRETLIKVWDHYSRLLAEKKD